MYFVRGSKKILVQKKKYSICDMVGKSEGKSCPLQPGDHVLGFTKFLPKKTPTVSCFIIRKQCIYIKSP